MKLAVLQSNYLPWKGYFDIIHKVDLFLFYDEVQYTKNDWRNRNRIQTRNGMEWITVPVHGTLYQRIDEVEIVPSRWQMQHYQKLVTNYARAPFFNFYRPFLEDVYLKKKWQKLSDLNQYLIQRIAKEFLGIKTNFGLSTDYVSIGSGHEKLLSLIRNTGATAYLSGPAAKNYIIASDYTTAGIRLEWMDYSEYPQYPQQFLPYQPNVSILDMLFNLGEKTPAYIWGG